MKKQVLIAVSILIGSSILNAESTTPSTSTTNPAVAPAAIPAAPPTEGSDQDISKTTWLNTIVPMLPTLICKGFMGDPDLKQRLDSIKMDYDQCVSSIPESVSKCQNQLYANIPEKINNTDAGIWGKALGECIGKDFAMKYLLPKPQ
jgi:hypothetical protein